MLVRVLPPELLSAGLDEKGVGGHLALGPVVQDSGSRGVAEVAWGATAGHSLGGGGLEWAGEEDSAALLHSVRSRSRSTKLKSSLLSPFL